MEYIVLGIRILLGTVFLVSAASKIPAPSEFIKNAHKYRVLPQPIATAYAVGLIFMELVTGPLLLLGFYSFWAAGAAALMLTSFICAVGLAIVRKQAIDCSCFGLLYRERVGWVTLGRDALLLSLALVVVFAADHSVAVGHMASRLSNPGYVIALAAIAIAFCLSILVAYLYLQDTRGRRLIESEFEAQSQGLGG